MAVINPHTTRATGTVLTAAIYNTDHQNHITNANNLNIELAGVSSVGASTGIIVSNGAGVISGRTLQPTANQIAINNANGLAGDPTISIATNPTLPGNVTIGGSLTASGGVATLSPVGADVILAPTTTGKVTINPSTAGTINNMSIGVTTRAAGNFTTLNSNGGAVLTGALSGVTTLGMGGALTGATTGTFSGAVTAASLVTTGVITSGTTITADRFSVTGGTLFIQNTGAGGMQFAVASAEVMRATSSGLLIGNTVAGNNTVGCTIFQTGLVQCTAAANISGQFNRTNDGTVFQFGSAGSYEGNVSIAGTVCTYGTFMGSHVSQCDARTRARLGRKLGRGMIVESIDQKGYWKESENIHLPNFKISEEEASNAVYGVFAWWDMDDEYKDANIAALGTFMVRLQKGTECKIGDLIESAGNGYGRVQEDNIIRASTVAKIDMLQVVETFKDGSFNMPATIHCG